VLYCGISQPYTDPGTLPISYHDFGVSWISGLMTMTRFTYARDSLDFETLRKNDVLIFFIGVVIMLG
jgi:hypothetical protein